MPLQQVGKVLQNKVHGERRLAYRDDFGSTIAQRLHLEKENSASSGSASLFPLVISESEVASM
jgi:hypothetical protein